jgi:hypothetical protein
LQQRDMALETELRGIEAQRDVAALGTPEERAQWARIQRDEAVLGEARQQPALQAQQNAAILGLSGVQGQMAAARDSVAALGGGGAAPESAENAELRERLALVKGVLFYRLNDAYGARLWQEHRELKDLSLALNETQSRWIRVERARKEVPVNTGDFAARVTSLRLRIDALETRLVQAEQQQRDYLAQVAVRELQQQKDRLATYQIQARFELGTMYDRAARQQATQPGKAPAPVQKGAEDEPGNQTPEPPK